MKASLLVTKLQNIISLHGDIDVYHDLDVGDAVVAIGNVSVCDPSDDIFGIETDAKEIVVLI